MTNTQFNAEVPEPNDENTMALGDFRKNLASVVNRADWGHVVTYVRNATEKNRVVGAFVPEELVRDYVRLRELVDLAGYQMEAEMAAERAAAPEQTAAAPVLPVPREEQEVPAS